MDVIRRAIATPVVMAIVPLYQKLDSQCLDPANRVSIVEGLTAIRRFEGRAARGEIEFQRRSNAPRLLLAKDKGSNEKLRENDQSTRSHGGSEAESRASQYATHTMMAVEVIFWRIWSADILETDDAAKGIENRKRQG
jgi:hypothetical protein